MLNYDTFVPNLLNMIFTSKYISLESLGIYVIYSSGISGLSFSMISMKNTLATCIIKIDMYNKIPDSAH